MDIQMTEHRIFRLEPRLSADTLRQRAMDRRTTAFGGGIGGLLGRPKADDVELVAFQQRVEPFWHVSCRAHYVYDRSRTYSVPPSAPDVRSVTLLGQDYPVEPTGKGPAGFALPVVEHCREEYAEEVFVDAVTGAPVADGLLMTSGEKHLVDDPATLADGETIVVPAEERASSVVRQLLARMLRPLQADVVTEESLEIDHLELFYRPVTAFQFRWPSKDKVGVLEFDALTGEARSASSLRAQLTRVVTRDALFDIGADTVGLLIPGGNIAVKVARVAIDRAH
jgi:hypothetical protein